MTCSELRTFSTNLKGSCANQVHTMELTYPLPAGAFESMIFPFPKVGYGSSLKGYPPKTRIINEMENPTI